MKRILLLCLLFLGLASSLRAEDSLKLDFRYENVPEKQQFLGDIVQTRIAERSAGGILALTFRIDAGALDPEEFTLEENGETRTATITAGSFRGLVFGAGAFLRSLDYGVDSFGIPTLSLREKPNLPFRACYFARHFHNWYHMADAAELERYVEDLALWGFNTIAVIMVPCINLDLDPTAQDWKDAVAGAKVIRSSAKRLDLTFVAMGGSNSVTRDMPKELAATPNIDPRRGNNGFNACPSKPGGLEFIDKKTRAVCGSFAGELADYICFWPFDEGGCECEKCGPWATNGYLKISAHNTEMIRDEFAPDVRFILSTWTYHEDEFETTWEWVKDHPEIEYVLADSHTDFPRYPLEHPLPPGHKLITFPEISMWGRFPWGGYGSTPLPGRFTNLWSQVRGHVDGCIQYSEGPFEDINKITVGRFYYGDIDADQTLREYAKYELCGTDPDDFVNLCHTLERIHVIQDPPPPEYKTDATTAMKLAMKIDSEILPSLRNCLRWRQFYCRCLLEYEYNVHGTRNTQTYADAIQELIKLYHVDRFPEGVIDEMHGCTSPQMPDGEIQSFPRPEEELK